MANARQCDRCGLYFNPLRIDHLMCRFRNPAFISKEDAKQNKVGSYLLQHEPPDAIMDLCPKCAEDFELFMDNTPLAVYDNSQMCEKDAEHVSNVVNKVCPDILPEGCYVYKGSAPTVTYGPAKSDVSSIDN